MEKNEQYIQLFACCTLTKGYTQTLLVDFERKMFELLPNEFYAVFTEKCHTKTYGTILNEFTDEDKTTAQEYFDYLIQHEYVFFCDKEELSFFPAMDMQWDYPATISNALIDFKPGSPPVSQYSTFFEELATLGCCDLQIRCYYPMPLEQLAELYQYIGKNDIYRTELIVQYDAQISLETYQQFLLKIPYINMLILHGYPESTSIKMSTDQKMYGSKEVLLDEQCCGNVSIHYFNPDLTHFTESLHFNTCLNRKIAVDAEGHIKNCPSIQKSFGQLGKTSLHTVIALPDFTKYGQITKEQVADCKVCEYRHICTDCRAYTNDGSLYGKPAKCTYNPYTGEWL